MSEGERTAWVSGTKNILVTTHGEETGEAQGESMSIPTLRCFLTERLQDCFDKEI